jgi:protein-S-isoprenylcysteine O-methyltransferase Ste14
VSIKDRLTLQKMRVPLGFLFGIVFMIFAKPEPISMAIGGVVAIVGILIRAWSAGHIRKNKELAISGPYSYTRNPLYLGSFLLGGGFCIASGVWWIGVIFIVLYLGIYFPVMNVEAGDLLAMFGKDFEDYAANVPLFFPRLSAYRKSAVKFDMQLYMKYREYRASLGLLIAWGVLALKAIFLR